jgi:flavorubredoxin
VGISSDQLAVENLNDSDLLVMGSPTHRMNLSEAVRPVLEALPRRVLKGKCDFLEGTVGYETFFNDFSRY